MCKGVPSGHHHRTEVGCRMISHLQHAPPRIVAFMDLGTNSVRLSVIRINPNHSYTLLTQQREVARLGDGEFTSAHLQQAAMDRAVLICAKFVELSQAFGAEEIIAVATSATREAVNQVEFLRRIRQEAKVDLRVVSGNEEARLIYLGVSRGMLLGDQSALFIDIGGGSTELIVGNQQEQCYLDSLKLGAIRLSNLFPLDITRPVSSAKYQKICTYVRNTALRSVQRIKKYSLTQAVGSSGTIENLLNVATQYYYKRPWLPADVLTRNQVRTAIELMRAVPLEERRKIPGLNPERADIIIAGAAIVDTLMEDLALTELRASTRSLRDGMLVDYLARTESAPFTQELSPRESSVLHLGRICAFDEAHARQVATLADELFESAGTLGLHAYGDLERELLRYAALLHDLGTFLSYHNHQEHTYYFIHNAELLGFDQTEVAIMASLAFFHRKPFPRLKHREFTSLEERARPIVRQLCVLLRMAESLDRGHAAAVAHAHLRNGEGGHIILDISAVKDCQLELWGVANHRETFAKAFGKRLVIEH